MLQKSPAFARRARWLMLALVGAMSLFARNVVAQDCGGQWLPSQWRPSLNGAVYAVAALPNPDPEDHTLRWAAGGIFGAAGGIPLPGIAIWDGTDWHRAGSVAGQVQAILPLADGSLLIAGLVRINAAPELVGVARWDPKTDVCTTLGSGIGAGLVYCLAQAPDGDIYAGGYFSVAGGTPCASVARWDGNAWSPLGTGITGTARTVYALAVAPDGSVIAGGTFDHAGGVAASNIARWNPAMQTWSSMAAGFDNTVRSLLAIGNADIVAGGAFTHSGATSTAAIAHWDGTAWNQMDTGLTGAPQTPTVAGLARSVNGDIIAVGAFNSAGATVVNRVARWDGTHWNALGDAVQDSTGFVYATTTLPDGQVIAGGQFGGAGGTNSPNVVRWNGTVWVRPDVSLDSGAVAIAAAPDGDLLLAGYFTSDGTKRLPHIARWNGGVWTAIGNDILNGNPYAICATPNGDVFVAGNLYFGNGFPSWQSFARWNGTAWSKLERTTAGSAHNMVALSNGSIVASGFDSFGGGATGPYIGIWDGTSWSPLGTGVRSSQSNLLPVNALVRLADDNIVAGGSFTTADGTPVQNVALWDTFAWNWHALGAGLSVSPQGLIQLRNGDLIATCSNQINRWNGQTWATLPGLFQATQGVGVSCAAEMLDGSIVVAGSFDRIDGVPFNHIARWDGAAWHAMGAGFDDNVSLIIVHKSGELIACGSFAKAGDGYSAYFARWTDTNIPWIAVQPKSASGTFGGSLSFSCTPATGYANLAAQWQIENAPFAGTYSPLNAGPIAGSSASAAITPLDPSTNLGSTTLTITGADAAIRSRRVRVVITNSCGSATSDPAILSLAPACYANCDGSTDAPVLGASDFVCFLGAFRAGDPYANCDGSTAPPTLSVADFICFLNAFRAGCP